MEPAIGNICMFGGNFAPRGWAFCDGQLLPISQNTALFSLIGTTYGGDGRTTFALPDLRGRLAIHAGRGPGLSNRPLGQKWGEEAHTLTTQEMPAHTHASEFKLKCSTAAGDSEIPEGRYLTVSPGGAAFPPYATAGDKEMAAGELTIQAAGGGQAHNNMMPYTAINYIIALQGVYPSRS